MSFSIVEQVRFTAKNVTRTSIKFIFNVCFQIELFATNKYDSYRNQAV